MDYDRRYILFLSLFNQKADYYTCHEVMEELWLEEGRDLFYQGLLQVAVGFYHLQNQNLGGAEKLLTLALEKLDPYPRIRQGIALQSFKEQVAYVLQQMTTRNQGDVDVSSVKIQVVDPRLKRYVEEEDGKS